MAFFLLSLSLSRLLSLVLSSPRSSLLSCHSPFYFPLSPSLSFAALLLPNLNSTTRHSLFTLSPLTVSLPRYLNHSPHHSAALQLPLNSPFSLAVLNLPLLQITGLSPLLSVMSEVSHNTTHTPHTAHTQHYIHANTQHTQHTHHTHANTQHPQHPQHTQHTHNQTESHAISQPWHNMTPRGFTRWPCMVLLYRILSNISLLQIQAKLMCARCLLCLVDIRTPQLPIFSIRCRYPHMSTLCSVV